MMDELRQALTRMTEDEPIVSDPEEGLYCFYCGAKPTLNWSGSDYTKHGPACEWLQARELLARINA